ncbi:MAG: hypothetical protein IJ587_04720 [Synergistaceae bacterium]|nr:hypothetical protein [Synergistaceae bacterium]
MKYPIAIIMTVCLILSLMVSFCPAETEEDFRISEIDEATFARMKGKSYKDDCPIPLGDLRLLHVLHKDLEGNTHKGELVCNVYIASDVLEIFKALYGAG